jgi:AcrR family transcriptional regulator
MALAEDGMRRLPRGSHGLTREEVVRSQRDRIFRAMIHVMAQKGYAATSVADVLRHAKVSRETFYEQFSSKQECFLAAFEAAVELVIGRAAGSTVAEAEALERFDQALRTYLDTLAAHPGHARLFLLEVYAAGSPAVERRAELQERFAVALDRVFGARTDADRFALRAFVAATAEMVTMRLAAGDPDGIRDLHGPLLELVRRVRAGGSR